eukprot:5689179-Alexandrium_andersonii.AAC.1
MERLGNAAMQHMRNCSDHPKPPETFPPLIVNVFKRHHRGTTPKLRPPRASSRYPRAPGPPRSWPRLRVSGPICPNACSGAAAA